MADKCKTCGGEIDQSIQDIHTWFNLTYSSYLVLHRSLLQSLPNEMQVRLVTLLNEMDHLYGEQMPAGKYLVRLRDDKGRFVKDNLCDYDRGRRHIDPDCKGTGTLSPNNSP